MLIVLLLPFFAGCLKPSGEETSDRLPVVVSIEPQAFFVKAIGGDRVQVEVLVPIGKEPETYIPTPDKIQRLSKCRLFFRVGFPSESTFLPKLRTLAPNLEIIDTREGIPLREMVAHSHAGGQDHDHGIVEEHDREHGTTEEHGHDHEADHASTEGRDPHIWLSPRLVKIQARTILQALVELDPAGKAVYEKNAASFLAELDRTQKEIAKILEPHKGETIFVMHPAYGYFCDEFGLKQKAIEVEGKAPKAKELADWIAEAKAAHVRLILVQPEFNPAPAEQIAKQIGAKVVVHSTLGPDYLNDLIGLAKLIAGN